MPTPELQREYARQWMAARRAAWFEGKICEECGSTKNLELDHRDPTMKVTHRVWSWRKERREAELAKCRTLCQECHKLKSAGEHAKGSRNGCAKLTEEEARQIRESVEPSRTLSIRYGIGMRTVQHIRKGDTWSHIGTLAQRSVHHPVTVEGAGSNPTRLAQNKLGGVACPSPVTGPDLPRSAGDMTAAPIEERR